MSQITNKELNLIKKELKSLIKDGDTELNHVEADEILCNLLIKLGYKSVVDIYQKIPKWFA